MEVPLRTSLGRATGLFGSMAVVMCGQGLLGTALGLRAEHAGFTTGTTSAVMAMYFVGFVFGARVTGWMIPRLGHRSTFVLLTALNAVVPMVHGRWVHPLPWAAGRLLTGIAMAGTYVVAESWLNELATNEVRGRLLAVYMVVSTAGMTIGQLLLNLASPDNLGAFVVSAALFALGVTPLLAQPPEQPSLDEHDSMSIVELMRLVPSGVIASALAGLLWGGLSSMSAVYASRIGFDNRGASVFVAAGTVGTVVLSWPINAWSDRQPRRQVIFRVAVGCALLGGVLMVVAPRSLVVYPIYLIFAGMTTAMYSLSSVYTNDWLAPAQRVAATSGLVVVVGIGSILGPLLIGGAMSAIGPRGFFATMVASHLALATYIRRQIAVSPDPVVV